MKERGILFSAPMVRAILAGAKSQTRRIVKPQPIGVWGQGAISSHTFVGVVSGPHDHCWTCPQGAPGDRLWVREAWGETPGGNGIVYRADELLVPKQRDRELRAFLARPCPPRELPDRWRPSIHMPRWASRITLEITCVRVERLQDISEADAIAEGVVEHQTLDGRRACNIDGGPMMACGPIHAYRALWESINGPGSWDKNPWVWVIEFRRV